MEYDGTEHNPGHSAPASQAGCGCWEKMNKAVAGNGMKLSDKGTGIRIVDGSLLVVYGVPLERLDGKKLARADPKCVLMSYCPFCGARLNTGSEAG